MTKISLRIALAMMPAIITVLTAFGIATAFREARVIETEMQRDADAVAASLVALGRGLSPATLARRLATVDARLDSTRVRLLPASAGVCVVAGVRPSEIRARAPILDAAGEVVSILEVSESLVSRDDFVRRALTADAIAVLLAALVAAGFAVMVGRSLVERRVTRMIRRLDQVGRGAAGPVLADLGPDELSHLARAVDALAAQLDLARADAAEKDAARRRAVLLLHRADRLAAVGKTVAVFAHEVGTPLAVISGRAERVIRNPAAPNVADSARIVRQQADRIAEFVRRLLDFARDHEDFEVRGVDLTGVVRGATALVTERLSGTDLSVQDQGLDGHFLVEGDPHALTQVVVNLLNNAADASPPHGCVRVHLGATQLCDAGAGRGMEREHLHITVEDDGDGVPAELRDRVFDPFFTTKPVGQGTGLGLAIVAEIVQDHGGVVTLANRASGGCSVVVHLPAYAPPRQPRQPRAAQAKGGQHG